MRQWTTFSMLCDSNDPSIVGDPREQVLRSHIVPFEQQPDAAGATSEHVAIWSAWAADNGLKHNSLGLGAGFAKLYKVNYQLSISLVRPPPPSPSTRLPSLPFNTTY